MGEKIQENRQILCVLLPYFCKLGNNYPACEIQNMYMSYKTKFMLNNTDFEEFLSLKFS